MSKRNSSKPWGLLAAATAFVVPATVLAEFSTIIHAPPDPIPLSLQSSTQLNLSAGGVIPSGYVTGSANGSVVDVQVNVQGGEVGSGFRVLLGSSVNFSGGVVGNGFSTTGGVVELSGGDFRVNGVELTTPVISLVGNDVFTGVLSDGSPLIFSREAFDYVSGVKLTAAPLPTLDTTPITVDGATSAPTGLRAGQSLNLLEGGVLANYFAVVDAALVVDGGVVGKGGEVARGTVEVRNGTIGEGFRAYSGSVVQIDGGSIGKDFNAYSGSAVTVTGGAFAPKFVTQVGSSVSIRGGVFGNDVRGQGIVELVGGDFRLNGAPITAPSFQFLAGNVLTGVLADGNSFVFSATADYFSNINLTTTNLPTIDTTPVVIDGTGETAPRTLRAGQSLTLRDGGVLEDYLQVVGSSLLIQGGLAGTGIEVVDGTIRAQGGAVSGGLNAYERSVVDIEGGDIGDGLNAWKGSVIDISGGRVGEGMRAFDAEINIAGGHVGGYFDIYSGSTVAISGGTFGRVFRSHTGSQVELIGGEFKMNGAPYLGSELTLPSSAVFTGTLADGSTFAFSREVGDHLDRITLVSAPLPELVTTPLVIDGENQEAPPGLRSGQSLSVRDGGHLPDDFTVVAATLDIEGGQLGKDAEIVGGIVNMAGGSFGDGLRAFSGSVVNISGGEIGERFHAEAGTSIHLTGCQFFLNDMPITGLTPGEAFTVSQRNAKLSGVLADGSAFDINLYYIPFATRDYVSNGALLTVKLASLPLPGDYNSDGVVDAADYAVWRDGGSPDSTVEGYNVWAANYGASATAIGLSVPEPSALAFVILGSVGLMNRRMR
jgi:hypothetical protein